MHEKKGLRQALSCLLAGAAVWLGLWGVMDDTALQMAAIPQDSTTQTESEEITEATVLTDDGKVIFVFPWLERLLAFFFPG